MHAGTSVSLAKERHTLAAVRACCQARGVPLVCPPGRPRTGQYAGKESDVAGREDSPGCPPGGGGRRATPDRGAGGAPRFVLGGPRPGRARSAVLDAAAVASPALAGAAR